MTLINFFRKINSKKVTATLCIWFAFLAVIFFAPNFVFAQTVGTSDLGLSYGTALGLTTTDIRTLIANIIRVALGLLGIVALLIIIYAGYLWMTAKGDDKQVDKAKTTMTNGVIGLAIILLAFAIVSFVISALLGGGAGGGGYGNVNGSGGNGFGGGAYGSGTIQSHYPQRDQTGVARNSSIAITFKVKYDPTTIGNATCDADGNCGQIIGGSAGNIRIFEVPAEQAGPGKQVLPPTDETLYRTDVTVQTVDNKTFVFKPDSENPLGNTTSDTWYAVYLSSGVKQASGEEPSFGTASDYGWMFQVSTDFDYTPPQIKSVVPVAVLPYAEEPRNVVLQINFNEPINPISSTGTISRTDPSALFNNLEVTSDGNIVYGTFDGALNQYATVEFTTDDLCATNSCGRNVYCLPELSRIKTLIKAASLTDAPPQAVFPFNGIVDFADNSLDGNTNGTAEGPAPTLGSEYNLNEPNVTVDDNVFWIFKTTDEIDLTPPSIEALFPNSGDDQLSGVTFATPIDITFTKAMRGSTLNSTNFLINIDKKVPQPTIWTNSFWVGFDTFLSPDDKDKTKATIFHNDFSTDSEYYPQITSGAEDLYQNCYQPCSDTQNCVNQTNWAGGAYPTCDRRQ